MRLIRTWQDVPPDAVGAAVAIGNFDGVHEGHRAVVGAAARAARKMGAPLGAVTFEPHPRSWLMPDLEAFRLTPFRPKARHLEALGVDFLYVLSFDDKMAGQPAEDFVRNILIDGLQVGHVVVGHDFVFGKERGGSAETLKHFEKDRAFELTIVPSVNDETGSGYSSTRIREALKKGDPAAAASLLGRHWEIEGHILPGDQRGRTIGFPTANMDLADYIRPKFGVYAIQIDMEEAESGKPIWREGMANLGKRPTIGDNKVLLEVNIFNFNDNIYGRLARVRLLDYVRPEMKFDGLASLKAQITADAAAARQMIAALSIRQ
ncbi:MAG: bifunctional riboflavin kinase/FAD synthetase [Rhodospirillaceae bacterium]|nr:bifunctional riboflavin kinase/FAD synthetase [Rhodospirillaceae bacterium]MCY4311026.1 bifunctional riboflavin kinase/FAD synthetase [Rhodospirillaceae bacterium]